jgi:exopolysaccharide biosynthesis protein
MFSGISPTSAQPRTAVGVTANREVVLFVCQGRGTTYAGLTTGQVANILKDLGCVEALNLDGGGSTCMLVNGYPVFTPSDGSQRAVASTVMIY